MSTHTPKSVFSRLDGITVLLYLALVTIGLLTVFSVEYRSTDPSIFMMNKSHKNGRYANIGYSHFTPMHLLSMLVVNEKS